REVGERHRRDRRVGGVDQLEQAMLDDIAVVGALSHRLPPNARHAAAVIDCLRPVIAAHGSSRSVTRRRGTVVVVNVAGSMPCASSSQVIGTATGAPARARGEYGAMNVAPRPLRR